MSTRPFVALVLQGRGALGAYHIGAFQALKEAGFTPDWVTGISIGAINAALIAGNRPEQQLSKLEEFWEVITRPSLWGNFVPGYLLRWYNTLSATQALMFGQPNFSRPHLINPYLAPAGSPQATSFYDNSPMRNTLAKLADFAFLNTNQIRISLGVTRARSGELLFFDNVKREHGPITPDHVIASTAIPPMFPGVRVNGELFWDGGMVANTPLTPVLEDQDQHPERDILIFMIDLWSLAGPEPQTMDEVLWRQNEIRFASRTKLHMHQAVERANLQHTIGALAHSLPTDARKALSGWSEKLLQPQGNMDIVHITYKPRADQTSESYVDFSRRSIAQRRADGYADMKLALDHKPWVAPAPREGVLGGALSRGRAALHEVASGELVSRFPGQL